MVSTQGISKTEMIILSTLQNPLRFIIYLSTSENSKITQDIKPQDR